MIPVTPLLWSRLPATALIAANLAVAAVTLFRGWGFYEIIIVYWCEAMIIGGYNMARMVPVALAGNPLGKSIEVSAGGRIFLLFVALGFFIAKFGGFALGMGLLIAMVPTLLDHAHGGGTRDIWHGMRAVGPGVAIAVAVYVVSHGVSFVMNFLARREYENANLIALLFWPYVRMSLVVAALAAGLVLAALFPALDTSLTFGVAVVLVKTAADYVMHLVEHALFSRKTAAA